MIAAGHRILSSLCIKPGERLRFSSMLTETKIKYRCAAWSIIIFIGLSVLSLVQYIKFIDWDFDDSYIVYRVVNNLICGNGWCYNIGENLNPCTSVLNTVLLVLFGFIFKDIPGTAHFIGLILIMTIGAITYFLAARRFGKIVGFIGGWAIIHNVGHNETWGIEINLLLVIILIFIAAEEFGIDSWYIAGVAALVRPDGILIGIFKILGYYFQIRKISVHGLLKILTVIGPWIIISIILFNNLFSNSLRIKMWQGNSGYWGEGWIYFKILCNKYVLHNNTISLVYEIICITGIILQLVRKDKILYLSIFACIQQAVYSILNVPAYHWYFAVLSSSLVFGGIYAIGCLKLFIDNNIGEYFKMSGMVKLMERFTIGAIVILSIVYISNNKYGIADIRNEAYKIIAYKFNEKNHGVGDIALIDAGAIGYYTGRKIVDITGLVSTNKEYISGRNINDYYEKPAKYILLHKPVWHLENEIYEDSRFDEYYVSGEVFKSEDEGLTMQLYILKENKIK